MDRWKDKLTKGLDIAKEKVGKGKFAHHSSTSETPLTLIKGVEHAKEKMEHLKIQEKVSNLKEHVGLGKIYEVNGKRYKARKLLGEGGFGYVFLVNDEYGGTYAMKQILASTKEQLDSTKNEIAVMKALPIHKNIVKMEDAASYRSQRVNGYEFYIIMEFCPGNVVDYMNGKLPGRFSEDEIYNIFQGVCDAVEVLHNREEPIAHRDIKVENVLISSDHNFKLCDFGSSTIKTYKPENERERNIAEDDIQKNTTMQYRAPEMIDLYRKHLINEKVDIWVTLLINIYI